MYICAICQTAIWKARDVCKGKIGQPDRAISELFAECTSVELKCDSGICKECSTKLIKYQEAIQVADGIRNDLLAMLQSASPDEQEHAVIESDCEYELEQLIEEDDGVEVEDVAEEEVPEEFIMEQKEVVIEMFDDECAEAEIQSTEEGIKIECVSMETDNQSNIEDSLLKYDNNEEGQNENEEEDNEQEHTDEIESSSHAVHLEAGGYIIQKDLMSNLNFPAKCEECGEPFKNKRSYRAHMKRAHFAGFICEQCGKTLYTRAGLLTHLQNHNEVLDFVCNECGQRFKNKFALKHHQAWHTGLKPFQCDVCSKQFVHYLGLYRHKKIHDDSSKCIKCEVCGFKFRTNAHLRRHMVTHTGAKPHSCPICGKCFTQSYNLKVHIQEHQSPGSTRQRRFKCKKCGRSFRNKENFHDHCQNECEISTK